MITDSFATWMWASSGGTYTYSFTVYCGRRNTTAYISLSKVRGNEARAYIKSYCYYASSDQILCPVSDGEGESVANLIYNAYSITFEVKVVNSFGYGSILLLFHN